MSTPNYNTDFKVVLRNYITADPTVQGLIGDRFFGSYLATFYTSTTDFPLVTFTPQIGSYPNLIYYQKFPILVNAYSDKHFDQAHAVFTAVASLLGADSSTGPVTIAQKITVRPTGTIYEQFEREARLYQVTGRFSVIWIP